MSKAALLSPAMRRRSNHLGGVGLLFDLLADEPLQEDLGREVFFLGGKGVDGMDGGCHLLLVLQGLAEDIHRRPKLCGRRLDCVQLHLTAALQDMVEEAQRVAPLLFTLEAHPMGKAPQIRRLEMGRHGEIELGSVEFFGNLAVDGFLYGLA